MRPDKTSAPPLSVSPFHLTEASCLRCRKTVWHWPVCLVINGEPATFDREMVGRDELLSLHGCHYELGAEDLDDPDYGWVEG